MNKDTEQLLFIGLHLEDDPVLADAIQRSADGLNPCPSDWLKQACRTHLAWLAAMRELSTQ